MLLKLSFLRAVKTALVLSVIVLSGCVAGPSTRPPETILSNEALQQAWQNHYAQAHAMTDWEVRGRAGVVTSEQSGAVTIRWERSPDSFSIYMSGPLGQTLARLEGSGELGSGRLVTLDVPGEKSVTASSAEKLLYRQTGWVLPFSSLDYWMRGIPAPNTDFVRVLNSEGYLAELEQNGWQVVYGSYKAVGSVRLPSRIKATRGGVRVIFSIREWVLH
ncbi:lipoprotein insertase outer membrane protein LolB [Sansalvadorimonas verongulae]|uniref:lipoprotein insertase outer membrane protein LolB n=1 Tax=Sansalvadorimonas verongulae TaxID=2172824 RepID=UPI0012BD807A|nr:lipoprotein insertase outer membrane protein LolB [Sansalvadorimonas verongulae]MTI15531.1 outer membrane lipoprotein LolB [Sansalvadorimonas verongulae]